MKAWFYFEIFLLILSILGYNSKEKKEEEKVDIEKLYPEYKWWQWLLLPIGVLILLVVMYGPICFLANLHSEVGVVKWENDGLFLSKDFVITLIVLVLWTHFFYFSVLWYNGKITKQYIKQNKLETKQTIQKETTELKKELLETKTALLLIQNKLREEREKTSKEKI